MIHVQLQLVRHIFKKMAAPMSDKRHHIRSSCQEYPHLHIFLHFVRNFVQQRAGIHLIYQITYTVLIIWGEVSLIRPFTT